MAKITSFDRKNLKVVRADINTALEKALAKHGLTAELGNITFTPGDFRVRLEVQTVGDNSTDGGAERKFKKYAFKFGMTGEEFGKTFRANGKAFTIVGINPNAKRGGYPVLAKNARGTTYKFSVLDIAGAK